MKGNIMIEKPKIVSDDHIKFLDVLRESGATNMFGSVPYLQEAFPELTKGEAKSIFVYWMRSFGERKEKV